MSMLEIENLQVVYPNGTQALQSVSMRIEAREVVAIIGRSGAGKSTLLRCINGMQKASSGTIKLDGEDVTHLPPQQRAPPAVDHGLGTLRAQTIIGTQPARIPCARADR